MAVDLSGRLLRPPTLPGSPCDLLSWVGLKGVDVCCLRMHKSLLCLCTSALPCTCPLHTVCLTKHWTLFSTGLAAHLSTPCKQLR
mmetsp:Transcript_26940/g.48465  ORF Transcript_26940/g.48465 Transcript_26940/m.48465 type:complete len:85 (+) Transcript_26940:1385-1639(+)